MVTDHCLSSELAEAGADNIRLLNFNIFPALACAQLVPGVWNFTLPDAVMDTFMTAIGNGSPIIDRQSSPASLCPPCKRVVHGIDWSSLNIICWCS